jgi:hypothetical protein
MSQHLQLGVVSLGHLYVEGAAGSHQRFVTAPTFVDLSRTRSGVETKTISFQWNGRETLPAVSIGTGQYILFGPKILKYLPHT